jgi:hypothetical protein
VNHYSVDSFDSGRSYGHLLGKLRYNVNGTLVAAHGGVATPWNSELCAPCMDVQERPLPLHVEQEFVDYLKCGWLEHDFLRVPCTECHYPKKIKNLLLEWSG